MQKKQPKANKNFPSKQIKKNIENRIDELEKSTLNSFSLGAICMAKMALEVSEKAIADAKNYDELRVATNEIVNYLKNKIEQKPNFNGIKIDKIGLQNLTKIVEKEIKENE